jgi:hypothetical protein
MLKMKTNKAFITPKQCVMGVLNDLGYDEVSFSAFSHKVMGAFF